MWVYKWNCIIMIRNKYIYDFWESFLLCIFCSSMTGGDVNYNYIPEWIVTWEEHKKNYTWRRKREICLRKKQRSCWVKQGRTSVYFLSFKIFKFFQKQRDFIIRHQEIRLTLLSSLGAVFYQMSLTNAFLVSL